MTPFLPSTRNELKTLGWDSLDVILVTGDTYIDSPYIGVSVIGKVLVDAGYRVGIIAQPDTNAEADIGRLGEPSLFWGITSGCMDSMVSNYTATKKKRHNDDLTAGGKNTRRPDLAVIAYTNLVRRYFKNTKPIVIGGIEASLRRISHYHYWTNTVRRSILFDAKADILVYGMGERTVLEIAGKIKVGKGVEEIRGTCYAAKESRADYLELPSHQTVSKDRRQFAEMFKLFYANSDPISARGLCQKQDTRYLIQNPPQFNPAPEELDRIHELDYANDVHPFYRAQGEVRALDTIRFSIISHRGCYGQCNFCSIAVHQGQTVISRSEASIVKEAEKLTQRSGFKGIIQNVGGPTANMYGFECQRNKVKGICSDKRCLTPDTCNTLKVNHTRQIGLLRKLRRLPGIKKVFIASGIRHDLVLRDTSHGRDYLEEVIKHHISGQMKIAPEHSEDGVLRLMGKPGIEQFVTFKKLFDRINKRLGMKQFLTCYFMAAFPGCRETDMQRLKSLSAKVLGFRPQQIQIFTPTPSSPATLMYHTERSYENDVSIFVEKDNGKKNKQKSIP
ncbi:MAG: YgiQ family radical SAM protein [Proteobacteria bacterium]|nr:YgiQ family radical SAM protein [Pseudomonadota bacterium]